MLDDDDRIAGIAQFLQAADEPLVVALMQPDGGFVEDIKHVDQLRADLRGQADALALAARKRPRRPGERKVAQAHLHQEPEPLANLLDDLLGDAPLLFGHPLLDMLHPGRKLLDREGRDLGDILVGNPKLQRLGFET